MRLALCDLEAPGWGEPWFPHCAFVASWLTDCCMAPLRFVVSLLFSLAIPIPMIPTPGKADAEGGGIIRTLLAEFLRGFSLRTLIFLLDMVLPQLDAYHTGRQLQHLQPWVSVELAQQHLRGQAGTRLKAVYQYEAYAGFHVIQLLTEGAPILLFSDPTAIPHATPWDLCSAGNLGSMESNVMAGRALLGSLLWTSLGLRDL